MVITFHDFDNVLLKFWIEMNDRINETGKKFGGCLRISRVRVSLNPKNSNSKKKNDFQFQDLSSTSNDNNSTTIRQHVAP